MGEELSVSRLVGEGHLAGSRRSTDKLVSGKGESTAPSCQSEEEWEALHARLRICSRNRRRAGLQTEGQGQVELASGLGQAGLGNLVPGEGVEHLGQMAHLWGVGLLA